METDLCSDSFLTSSAFSHLPSCPYLCFSYYSSYTVRPHSCLTQSWNVWIPPRLIKVLLWNVTRFVLFFTSMRATNQTPNTSELMVQPLPFQCRGRQSFFPTGVNWDPIWTPQVSGLKAPRSSLLRPCSLLLWGHQKIWSVHSSFS